MKAQKIEAVKNLITHKTNTGTLVMDLTEGKYYHEVEGVTTEITEEAFRIATKNDKKITLNLIDK